MWERALVMRLVRKGAVGGGTRDVACADRSGGRPHVVCCPRPPTRGPRPRARCRHQLAVVWSYLGRFLTRVVGELTRHMAHIVRGAFVHMVGSKEPVKDSSRHAASKSRPDLDKACNVGKILLALTRPPRGILYGPDLSLQHVLY